MANLIIFLAALLTFQPVDASACSRLTLMVNSSHHPWIYYWTPAPSTLAPETTCVEVLCSVKISESHALELANGLERARGLTKLSFELAATPAMPWQTSGMDKLFNVLSALPIDDFTLWPSTRDYWPTDGIPKFLKVLPQVTALKLKLRSGRMTDEKVAAWVNVLPAGIKSLSVSMGTSTLSGAGADTFIKAFGEKTRFASLKDIDLDVSSTRSLPSESRLEIFQALQGRQYRQCSLLCDEIKEYKGQDIKDVADKVRNVASVACAGTGNCAGSAGQLGGNAPIAALVTSAAVILVLGICIYRRNRAQGPGANAESRSFLSEPGSEMSEPGQRLQPMARKVA